MTFLKQIFQKRQNKQTAYPTKQELIAELKKQDMIESERHALSIILVQKLVNIYEQNTDNLIIRHGEFNGWNPSTYSTVSTQDGKFIYTVLHQKSKPHRYWLEVNSIHNSRATFGLYLTDNLDFQHEIGMLYNLTHYDNHNGISDLMSKDVKVDLKNTSAWPLYRINIFPYLDTFLQNQKG